MIFCSNWPLEGNWRTAAGSWLNMADPDGICPPLTAGSIRQAQHQSLRFQGSSSAPASQRFSGRCFSKEAYAAIGELGYVLS